MTARIVRPRSDSPRLPLTLGGVVVGVVLGFSLGARVFRPTPEAAGGGPGGQEPASEMPVTPATPDPTPVGRPAPPTTADAGPAATVAVRLAPGTLTACGEGEELNLAAAQCDNPPGFEPALRARLAAVLPRCPSAPAAASHPGSALFLGLRVDRPRRRVAVLLGRRSTVPEKVSYVACASEGLRDLPALWSLPTAHPRYLYEFVARFSPLGLAVPDAPVGPGPAPPAPVAPAPAAPAPIAPVAPAPAAPATSATPAGTPGTLPSPAELGRMRATGRATVTWSAAVVREAPRTGAIVARIPQGTEVELLDRRGGWFAIRWGRSNNVGWTFREAIGQ